MMKTGTSEPHILPRSAHPISRKDIDPDALKVLYRLHRSGFKAYLVGGAVRDLLLGKKPKDFDVATDARPGQIKKLFANCFLIGRRFRLAHIRFKGGKIIEVATFRREPHELDEPEADKNNTFGTPMEDAFRRDITINALFYDIGNFSIIDYVGGLEDIRQRRVCIVGDPSVRYTEDPVRMWRVIRYASRQNFSIEEETARAIEIHRELLATSSGSRLFEELNKDILSGFSTPFFRMMASYHMLGVILGGIGKKVEQTHGMMTALLRLLETLDAASRKGDGVSQNIAYSILFWPWVQGILREKGSLAGDRMKLLADEFMAASMPIILPKVLRTNVIHTLYILDRMMNGMRTGRMKWMLTKRAHYPDAAVLFSLLEYGHINQGQDPFLHAFRMKYPDHAGERKEKVQRKRRRRYRKSSKHQVEASGREAAR
jgi:poly(A) polymerase